MIKSKIAIFPGTFDPFHLGHKHIVENIIDIFDQIFITITDSADKITFLPIEKRIQIIEKTLSQYKQKINIVAFNGLLPDVINNYPIDNQIFIVRGARTATDFENETKLFCAYQKLCLRDIKPLLIPAKFPYISSSIIRNILKTSCNTKNIEHFLDSNALPIIFD